MILYSEKKNAPSYLKRQASALGDDKFTLKVLLYVTIKVTDAAVSNSCTGGRADSSSSFGFSPNLNQI